MYKMEYTIPDFLRRENRPKRSEEDERFFALREEYEKKFNRDFSTEGFSYSCDTAGWIRRMEYCLEHNVLMQELTGEPLT